MGVIAYRLGACNHIAPATSTVAHGELLQIAVGLRLGPLPRCLKKDCILLDQPVPKLCHWLCTLFIKCTCLSTQRLPISFGCPFLKLRQFSRPGSNAKKNAGRARLAGSDRWGQGFDRHVLFSRIVDSRPTSTR